MNFSILTIFFYLYLAQMGYAQNVGIGTSTPLNKIHVAGDARIESLAGTSLRVVQTNSSGEVLEIPQGNTGEILTQTAAGPTWKPNTTTGGSGTSSNLDTCCPRCGVMKNEPCPTMISTISTSTMTLGNCLRYCAALTEGGYSDWRVPTGEEATRLYYLTPVVSTGGFWTVSTATGFSYVVISSSDARRAQESGSNDWGVNCQCVR